MGPRIGIPLCTDERGRWKAGRNYHYIDAAYASAVESAGGLPVYLPVQANPAVLLDSVDALLLPGGDDFPPLRPYPEGVVFDPVPASQLAFDRQLLAGAWERGMAVLAICYGMQLLAEQSGGKLLYDIATDRPDADPHTLPEAEGRHPLQIEPGTRLAKALGNEVEPVNSLHHQGVAEPGAGMRISARAGDGTIEAIERPADPFCVGVQWHPEKLKGDHRDALFAAFIDAARLTPCGDRRETE
jgi:putative glutamine amidotransferase